MSAAELRIALLQLPAWATTVTRASTRGAAACRAAAAAGADLALFPELWSTGYAFIDGDLDRWRAQAIARDDPWVLAHADLAAELGMAIAVDVPGAVAGGPRNVVTLFDAAGREVLTYAKVHTCSFDLPEQALERGTGVPGRAAARRAQGPSRSAR